MSVNRICTISGCGSPVKARDWCQEHYNNWYRHGDPSNRPAVERVRGNKNQATPVATRFWSKVDFSDPDGCWPWRGSMRHDYGETFYDGEKRYTHRVAFELVYGELQIPRSWHTTATTRRASVPTTSSPPPRPGTWRTALRRSGGATSSAPA